MIHIRAVYYQKAVVTFFVDMYLYWRVLAVVAVQVQLKLAAYCLRIDVGFHSVVSLAEHQQYRFVHIIVYQQDGFLCRPYQVCGELVGIEQLAVIEYAFYRWQRGAHEEVYLAVYPV